MSDATQRTGVIVCLACNSREQVDTWVAKAVAAGGTATRPSQEHGFMDGHGFADPDGHIRALGHMAGKPDSPQRTRTSSPMLKALTVRVG